jgi:hypothetical protein
MITRKVTSSGLKAVVLTGAAALGLAGAAAALATNAATQTVSFTIAAINEISVSASTLSLTVNSATAGSAPTAATDNTTSYAITTNGGADGKRITAKINTDMPTGVTLSVELAAPTGASSSGVVPLTLTPTSVVTGIDSVAQSGLQIAYTLSATQAAGQSTGSKTVTFTIEDAS